MEVKGFRSRQDGMLVVPPNGPWRMDDGQVADIYGNDIDHNPINQVRANTLAAKNWIGEATGRRLRRQPGRERRNGHRPDDVCSGPSGLPEGSSSR
ncbi:hypothetical protein [Nocardia sp. NPDC004604]|uniref:hypothetical protein n=1 Tax=Nocardia sp. NPDC004604 TaxID=3157013 RepID=UPI0033BD1BDB